MTTPFISPAAIERLRNVARQKGLLVWIDRDARLAGKAFIWLQRNGCNSSKTVKQQQRPKS